MKTYTLDFETMRVKVQNCQRSRDLLSGSGHGIIMGSLCDAAFSILYDGLDTSQARELKHELVDVMIEHREQGSAKFQITDEGLKNFAAASRERRNNGGAASQLPQTASDPQTQLESACNAAPPLLERA